MNQNRGYKILLRLRPHEAQDTFYDQEQLVLVMLHEVSLPGHMPEHDECKNLMRSSMGSTAHP
jgi:hypothetical protein